MTWLMPRLNLNASKAGKIISLSPSPTECGNQQLEQEELGVKILFTLTFNK